MRRSIATVSLSGSLEEKLAAVSAAKLDGIELYDPDLVASSMTPGEIASRCADLGLRIEILQPFRDLEGLAPEDFTAALRRLEIKLGVMEQLGVTKLLVCSNTQANAIGDPDLSAEQLHIAAERAGEHGMCLAYEALAWGTHISRIGDASDVVRRAGHPALGITVDTFHMLARGDSAEHLDEVPGDRIVFLQIADAPALHGDLLQWSRHHRCFPGQGTFDLVTLVSKVVQKGYRGPLSLEVFSDVIRRAEPHATARDAMRSLIHLEEELRTLWDAQPLGERPHITLTEPPPAPVDVSCEFVEIAVGSDDDMSALLHGLGFRRVSTHRTKRVSWWRCGDAHVLLNASTDLEDRWPHSAGERPTVDGLGVSVPSVVELSERADALLWERLTLRHDPSEASREGVDTPAGIHLFFLDHDHWQEDFKRPSDEPAESARGIRNVDHVGYSIPFEVSDAEISFYRTLLGLPSGGISEITEPHGWLRSRVVRREVDDATSAFQVVLNVAETRATVRNQPRGINQIAFGVADIFSTVQSARDAGIGILRIPGNYYEDLRARFDLDPVFLGRLREHDVLYDRSPNGEVLHAYTRFVADAFYLELIQRVDGYTGFGAGNAPVRLVAQTLQTQDARPGRSADDRSGRTR